MSNCPCGAPLTAKRRTCQKCHAAYMRKWRARRPMTEEQKTKDRCRSYAGVYKRRGKLIQEPCFKCGSEESQMHHPDYTKPLEVVWLCRPCHLKTHAQEGKTPDLGPWT